MREEMPLEARSKLHKPLVRSAVNGQPGPESREVVPDDVQRWTARRRIALVLGILKGEMSVEEGARRHGLTPSEIEDWKERMLVAAHNALRSKPRDEEAIREEQFRRLKQKVGELVLEVDTLKEALRTVRSGGTEANDE